jgi:transcriptional regulator with XRE-family HTH domain
MYEQYIAHMQELFSLAHYDDGMAEKSRLRELRETAGLSGRELARLIGESSTNVSYWERSGQIPRSDVLLPMAKALGVSVEELLGLDKPRRVVSPGGKVRHVFEEVSKLPRRQQENIVKVVSALLAQAKTEAA